MPISYRLFFFGQDCNTEDLANIININSPGYNKFKTWYKNIPQEEKKEESITRKRINNLIVDNDAYELRLINKKVVKEYGIKNLAYSVNINNNYNLRNLNFLGNVIDDIFNNIKEVDKDLTANSKIQIHASGDEVIKNNMHTRPFKISDY